VVTKLRLARAVDFFIN